MKGAKRVFVQTLGSLFEMGGEQRQVETLGHLLLPGPNRDLASDASTMWGLTGQVGAPQRRAGVLTLACWALPRALEHLPVARRPPCGTLCHRGPARCGDCPQCPEDIQPHPMCQGDTANRTPSHPCRRGSPLLIGVRSEYKLSTEEVPVLYMTRKSLQEDRHVWVAHTWHQIQKVLRQLSLGSVFSKSFFTLDALHQYPQAQGMACCSGTCRQPARVPAVIWRVLFAAA